MRALVPCTVTVNIWLTSFCIRFAAEGCASSLAVFSCFYWRQALLLRRRSAMIVSISWYTYTNNFYGSFILLLWQGDALDQLINIILSTPRRSFKPCITYWISCPIATIQPVVFFFVLAGLNSGTDGGVVGGCADICGKLNDTWEQVVCTFACSAVGVDVFIHIIEEYVHCFPNSISWFP
jgi:hypothetical protein